MNTGERDVFLSQESEDKRGFVRPFADELDSRGLTYWIDEAEIKWGDKITQKLNEGLGKARYVIVFLSNRFLGKNWPESELGAALNRENTEGKTVVLPLILGDPGEVFDRYPLLRDKAYLKWGEPLSAIVDQLEAMIAGRAFVAPGQEETTWITEPTEDLYREMMSGELFPEFRPFLGRIRDSYELQLSVADLVRRLPSELQSRVPLLVETLRRRTQALREAIRTEPPSDGTLQLVAIRETDHAEFDVMLRNLSSETVYITRITLRLLKKEGMVLPGLEPSASYKIPVGGLSVGESNSLNVSHIIEPHKADRFLIALQTTKVLYLRLTLEYNKRYSVSANAWLWR